MSIPLPRRGSARVTSPRVTQPRVISPRDARMLAATDRLIREFEHVPVMTVIRAVGSARSALRDIGEPVTAEAVESLARARLVIDHAPLQAYVSA